MSRTTFAISEDVRRVLLASEVTETTLRLPEGQLERKLYQAVNKVLEGAGGKWSRKDRLHVFDRDPRDLLGLAIETGEARNVKKELQAFYTPAALARVVAKAAALREGHEVLEPSAGGGALVDAVLAACPGALVWTYEVDEVAFRRLGARGIRCERRDFLEVKPLSTFSGSGGFDRVVMNPPFTGGQDVEHVTHALRFLRSGGILVALVSPSAIEGTQKKQVAFQRLLATTTHRVFDVPAGAFRESGTEIRTKLVRVVKP